MKSNIESRITKLLEMANKGTKHEQTIAMIKAQELMLKYHIEMRDIKQSTKEKIVTLDIDSKVNCYSDWTMNLVTIMAKNFRCHPAYVNKLKTKGKRRSAVVLGFETDAFICKTMIEDGFIMINRLSKAEVNYKYRNREPVNGVKEAYIKGFLLGVEDGFEELIASNNQYALVIQEPEEVKAEAKIQFGTADFKTNSIKPTEDPEIINHGYNEGKKFAKNIQTKELNDEFIRI